MGALLVTLISFVNFLRYNINGSVVRHPVIVNPLINLILNSIGTNLTINTALRLTFVNGIAVNTTLPPRVATNNVLNATLTVISNGNARTTLTLTLPVTAITLLVGGACCLATHD